MSRAFSGGPVALTFQTAISDRGTPGTGTIADPGSRPLARLTSRFYVSALIRRVTGEGAFAAISRKGAEEAGAIFVLVDRLDGTVDLYGPAPQAIFDSRPDERLFETLISKGSREDAGNRLEREKRMDPDFWVVEIDSRDGTAVLPLIPEN